MSNNITKINNLKMESKFSKNNAIETINNLKKIKNCLLYSDVKNFIKYDIIDILHIDEVNEEDNFSVLKNLNNLKELHIFTDNSNILINIPISIKKLYIPNLDLENVNFIYNLKNLNILDISHNKFCNIMEIILPSTLEELYCNYCDINDYRFIKNLNNLKILSIAGNSGVSLSDNIPHSIENLNIESVEMFDYGFIENLKNLNILNLSYINKKNNLHLIKYPQKIKYLDIYESNIENFSVFIKNFPNLETFEFHNDNYLFSSSVDLSAFINLKILNLENTIINSDLLLSNTKINNITINFEKYNNKYIIELPQTVENIKIIKKYNYYSFIEDLCNLKHVIFENCTIIKNLTLCKSIKSMCFIQSSNDKNYTRYDFSLLSKLSNLVKLSLDIYDCNNLNYIDFPDSLTDIIIKNMELLKNINFLKKIKNLSSLSIEGIDNYIDLNSKYQTIHVDLTSIELKYFKVEYKSDYFKNCNINNYITYQLPNSIETIEYLGADLPNYLQTKHINLKNITIKSDYCFKNYILENYKNINIKLINYNDDM
ncbi:leucine rich repeat gene family [Adoxophyes honmai entomopoxvirus 'L']|uniref:Leucine rich repeat gene family n=1 Tax=Adoxophyes honmai entomopoxvirus 'L' TaxID=1293540 RepID=A0A916NX01_9POXV|nr:leucine rich repeat gene family [Adoxophyes honmai entomopoxvirus 'L']CCU55512.1 leucine rich repeat gene family [Adoxophyes honmai entomopoxvirus 'L']